MQPCYRGIDGGPYTPGGLVASPSEAFAPTLQWLGVSELRVDDGYQRCIDHRGAALIRKIVTTFDWRKFTPLLVCPVDGEPELYFVLDGQHRVTAAAALGITSVPCSVVQVTQEEQADIFKSVNGDRVAMHSLQLFWTRVVAKDPLAVAAASLAARSGITICRYPKSLLTIKIRETQCHKELEWMARNLPDPVSVSALKLFYHAGVAAQGCIGLRAIRASHMMFLRLPEWVTPEGPIKAVADVAHLIKYNSLADTARRRGLSPGDKVERLSSALEVAISRLINTDKFVPQTATGSGRVTRRMPLKLN